MNASADGEDSVIVVDDFDEVERCAREEIIGNGKAVTLEHLTSLSGKDQENRSHRHRVKEKLQRKFPDLSFFNCARNKESQIVTCKSKSEEVCIANIMAEYKDEVIKFAAAALRKDVLTFVGEAPQLPWPPSSKDLCAKE